ncbi:O-antigen ligase family protein [Butyrivibrio sp.]|uniref:O-antigen ligase family protein n=1 Tax=Butyrivibrio sp. TaxID=28121 RepID=UPI0025C33914|nr:O-antigen ligase family protein [Butyrivibrio sp.]
MSNAGHSLGYGLFLVTAMPFAGIDLEANEYNIFKRPLLLIGTIINIFLTGSRSSLGIMVLEFALMFIFTEKKYIKMNIVSLVVFSSLFMAVVFATQSTSFGKYIMLQITLLIDTLFDTTFSIKYGADLTNMKGSSNYRRHIWRIFFLKWLNPILGQGKKRGFMSVLDDGSVIRSIDNFYVYHYVMYAYPGLISYCLFLISMGLRMIIEFFRSKSALVKMVLIGTIGYYIHLSVVDALMTLKYQYVLFAIFICLDLPKNEKNLTSSYFGKKKSVYIKE